MSQPNAFSPFSFSPSSLGFTFCAGRSSSTDNNDNNNNAWSKPAKRRFRPSVHNNRKSPPTPPQCPPAFSEKGAEDDNLKTPNHDEVPETIKTKFTTLSAVTGVIPCHFEGSSYCAKLQSPTFCTPEQSTKKETHEKSESNPPSTQLVLVSRILKGIPQNPHFIPLKAFSNVAKQRLINAWDNIFEETVDNLRTMKVTGFSVDSNRLWETMEELDKMGYNVILLRRRLVELTDVLISQRRHKKEILRLKNEAEQHRMEKNRLEFEIVKLRAKVEAEKASVEDVLANIAKMEEVMPLFDAHFSLQAIKKF